MQLKVNRAVAGLVRRRFAAGKPLDGRGRNPAGGFTLVEVMISAAILILVFGSVINCYIQSGQRVEWTGYSLAAQSMATEVLEQARSATWLPSQTSNGNNLTNLNLLAASYNSGTLTYTGYTTNILDVPYSGNNYTMATNFVTVQMLNVNGNAKVQMQFIRVDTVWPFYIRKANLYFTNTVATMVAPDDMPL